MSPVGHGSGADSTMTGTGSSRLPFFLAIALGLLLVYSAGLLAPQVHAQTTTNQTKISINPTSISGLNYVTGSTITFEVNVTNAPSINSFATSVEYNPKVLQAVAIDYTSSSSYVLGQSASAYIECIDGVSPIGGACTPLDDIGVVTLYATTVGTATKAPTSGPLFNVTFNVVSQGFSDIHFLVAQVVGCNSSGICGQPVTSLSSDGYFSSVDCFTGTLCTPPVPSVSSSPLYPSVVYAGEPVGFNASKSTATNPGATIVSYSWLWGGGEGSNTTSSSSITHVFANIGFHDVTLGITDSYGITAFTSTIMNVLAPLEVFSITPFPSELSIGAGAMGTTYLSIVNLNGISGNVQLTAAAPAGFTTSFNTTTISSSGTAQLNLTASARISPGTYLVNVTGTTSELAQTTMITVTVPVPVSTGDFSISPATPTTVKCTTGSTCNATITITAQNGFSGTVTFTVAASNGLTCNIPSPVTESGTTILSCSAAKRGSYSVSVTGTSGSLSHETGIITYQVVPAPHAHHRLLEHDRDRGICTGTLAGPEDFDGGSTLTTDSIITMMRSGVTTVSAGEDHRCGALDLSHDNDNSDS